MCGQPTVMVRHQEEETGPVLAEIAQILQAGEYGRPVRRRPRGGALHSRSLTDREPLAARPRPPTTATSLCRRDYCLVIADGPFAETKELILGMVVMEPRDLDASSLEVVGQIPPPASARSR